MRNWRPNVDPVGTFLREANRPTGRAIRAGKRVVKHSLLDFLFYGCEGLGRGCITILIILKIGIIAIIALAIIAKWLGLVD